VGRQTSSLRASIDSRDRPGFLAKSIAPGGHPSPHLGCATNTIGDVSDKGFSSLDIGASYS
jgi:hypothetical protein